MELTPIIVVALLFGVFPAVVLHYIAKMRTSKSLSVDDEHMLEDLWKAAKRMERRIESLEAILDAEAPQWRGREEDRNYERN
ncbi:MAG: envelope stress response membrane protein PspB [Maricaulaceae bacterium]